MPFTSVFISLFTLVLAVLTCKEGEFICTSGSCVNRSLVCNENQDCLDGSDEGSRCGEPCLNETCEQNCRRTTTGPECYCNTGYKLNSSDNRTCNDINECETDGFCGQHCSNIPGSFQCSCLPGYELFERSCLAAGGNALLVFTTRNQIRGMYLGSKTTFLIKNATDKAIAVDIDPLDHNIYWIQVSNTPAIYSSKVKGTGLKSILNHGLILPEDLAVDYVAGNLYLTDSGLKQVIVCQADGQMCSTLHKTDIEKPRSIVVDPSEGFLYWSDWGRSTAGIYRSGMDGSDRMSLVSTNITWPNGIALDQVAHRLYWVDAKLRTIEYVSLNGKTRKLLLKDAVRRPFSLSVFEDKIFWTDWRNSSLNSCNKFTGQDKKTLVRTSIEKDNDVYGVQVYHPVLALNVTNPCWSHECSHMCLISPGQRYRCACPAGFVLSSDSKLCEREIQCDQPDVYCRKTNKCISHRRVCDGLLDCVDGSDEQNCSLHDTDPTNDLRTAVECDGLYCNATVRCIPWSRVCDGTINCDDMDEGEGCNTSCIGNGGCSQICRKTPLGPLCSCHQGYRLLSDNKTCEDINECEAPGFCSHFCNNTEGGFNCSCLEGYILSHDQRMCKADGDPVALMFVHGYQVLGVDLVSGTQKVYANLNDTLIKGMDLDVDKGVIYWTEYFHRTINSYTIDTGKFEVILKTEEKPVFMKWDWITKNMYYTDDFGRVYACSDVKYCSTLITQSEKISGFDISPTAGLMFWSGTRLEKQTRSGIIKRADLDGDHSLTIISSYTAWPTTVTTDHALNRIYWIDKHLQSIDSADFNGLERRRVLATKHKPPLSIAIFEDFVYWINAEMNSLERCNKFSGKNCIRMKENVWADTLMVVHKVQQRQGKNPCKDSKCDHLSLLSPSSCACRCADGYKSLGDTCVPQ